MTVGPSAVRVNAVLSAFRDGDNYPPLQKYSNIPLQHCGNVPARHFSNGKGPKRPQSPSYVLKLDCEEAPIFGNFPVFLLILRPGHYLTRACFGKLSKRK